MIRGLLYVLFFVLLGCVAYKDFRFRRIDDWGHLAILVLAGAALVFVPEISLPQRVAGFFVVSVPFLAIDLMVPGAFGGGDIKLVAASGAFLGWRQILEGAVWGIFLGGFWALYLLVVKKKERTSAFALGPFLCSGMLITVVKSVIH